MAKQLFTIGYSGFPDADEFVRELKKYGVQIVIDVRSSPYSAYYSAYNREPLSTKFTSLTEYSRAGLPNLEPLRGCVLQEF